MTTADDDLLHATTAEQAAALAHPARNRLLFALGEEGSTVSRLATGLRTNKGNVAHHLGVLERAGLVRVSHTRTVRGGTERYFVRTARRLRAPGGDRGEHTAALLQAVAEEITSSPTEPMLHLRRIRLTAAQAAAVTAHLERVVHELPEAPRGAPAHGVLVSVFRRG